MKYMQRRREESEKLREEITSDPEYKRRIADLIQRGREKGLRP